MKFLLDFFPVLLFFVIYKIYGIIPATAVAIAASALQVAIHWLRHRRTETMHLVTLGILGVFGGLTIAFQDNVFIMWKPTVVNWLFAGAFLASHLIGKRKPLIERMMSHAINVPDNIWTRLNLMWVGFFLALGLANLYVAGMFFEAETALKTAVGPVAGNITEVDSCAGQFQGTALLLCETAKARESDWVDFKLFGMMGLTFIFVLIQAFYLARHVRDDSTAEHP